MPDEATIRIGGRTTTIGIARDWIVGYFNAERTPHQSTRTPTQLMT